MLSDAKLYIAMISPHGLMRSKNMELGRDADTGGQIKYVLELARALVDHPDVEKVDVITRLVADPKVGPDYSQPREEIAPGANIVRISCGPRRYLRKEALWPYLDVFADNISKYFRSIGRAPNLLHAHYADGGYVGSKLAGVMGIPLAYTGHSLGRVKRLRFLEQGMKIASMENRYHIGRRIDAEETTLDNSAFVVASTSQEVEEQYQLYDNYQPRRMVVIPPGVDLERFKPPTRFWNEYPPIWNEIARFLKDQGKPIILAMSRPDARKNISTLIKAFGENRELRAAANLVIIAGSRGDISAMEKGARDIFSEIFSLVDRYDLYGQVAYPKNRDHEEPPVIYRIATRSKGVFVNPALTEPFGLTLIEAAASGLPVVATQDGGPRDIIGMCKNGSLIDPRDHKKMGEAIVHAISDKARWRRWSKNGVNGAHKHYSWAGHVAKYIKTARKVITQYDARSMRPTHKGSLVRTDRVLVCDIDNTLIGDEKALAALLERLSGEGDHVGFGVATGRSLELALKVLRQWKVPRPNLMITSVGSQIFYGRNLMEEQGWKNHINYRWRPDRIRELIEGLPGLKPQPKEGQGSHKISYFVDPGKAPRPREIARSLRRAGVPVNVVYSHQAYLDVLPVRASKGSALRYFAAKWAIPLERFLVAGDSGNDEEMLSGNTMGVVVSNHSPELNKLKGRHNIYFSKGAHAWGIIEALEHYDFFGDMKPKT